MSDTLKDIIVIASLILSAPVLTWAWNMAKGIWKRQAEKAKQTDESLDKEAVRKRENEAGAVANLERIIERLHRDYDLLQERCDKREADFEEKEHGFYAERKQIIRERDHISATLQGAMVQMMAMTDRIATLEGVGPEGAEKMDPVLAIDSKGKICWANDPAGISLGYPTLRLIGLPMTTILPKERHDFFRQTFRDFNERLARMRPNFPLKEQIPGAVRKAGGETAKVCAVINGFRVDNECSQCKHVDQVRVFRVHLRPRYEPVDVALDQPYIPLNSSDGSTEITTAVMPEADQPEPSQPDSDK